MTYIDRNGRVLERRPWDAERILGIFITLWYLAVQFFTTLLTPFRQSDSRLGNSRRSGGGWGGGGGGGGGGGDGWGNGGGRPNRRIGRISNTMDVNMPCSGGGCPRQ